MYMIEVSSSVWNIPEGFWGCDVQRIPEGSDSR
ncbi:hypothetical protein KSS87_019742 [Heliosperma pusillum]|nr:hypothetical protein KSS87_019742 [Heliosperma pusillum]